MWRYRLVHASKNALTVLNDFVKPSDEIVPSLYLVGILSLPVASDFEISQNGPGSIWQLSETTYRSSIRDEDKFHAVCYIDIAGDLFYLTEKCLTLWIIQGFPVHT